jgi:hypothetical protein
MKKTLLIIALMLILSAGLAACSRPSGPTALAPDAPPNAVPDLTGEYVVNGFDPLGTEYSGTLTIQPGDNPGEYHLIWIIVGSIQEGTGSLNGNQLEVAWHSSPNMNRQTSGKTIYTVTTARQLKGQRFTDGYDTAGTETAYPNN